MLSACKKALAPAEPDMNFLRMGTAEFGAVSADNIDCSIMEKTEKAAVLPAEFGWSDVCSFSALARAQEVDSDGNVIFGDVISVDTKNCFIHSDGHLISTVGVEDLFIVTIDDAIVVANYDQDQNVEKSLTG